MSDDVLAALRAEAARRFPIHEIEAAVEGRPRPLRVTLPSDPDGPFDQLASALNSPAESPPVEATDAAGAASANVIAGLRMPYWAVIWPSGVALAEGLMATPELARGKRVLEIGCGLGLTACAALDAGADLLVADCFSEALLFTRINTLANTGREPRAAQVDWRTRVGRDALLAAGPFDLVLGADVLYEDDDVATLLDLLPKLTPPPGPLPHGERGKSGAAWIAEPGRIASEKFARLAIEAGWGDQRTSVTRVWPTESRPVTVTMHHYALPSLTH